jgi:hypothetical protein
MPSIQAIWEGKIDRIDEAIKSLQDEHEQCPGLLLTEEDLRLHLCIRLMKIFNEKSNTDDNFQATQVHAEVAWYDEQGHLTLRPDITILEPKALRLCNQRGNDSIRFQRLPSKQFVYAGNGSAVIFELKYLRGPREPRTETINAINHDTKKMKDLLTMWNYDDIPTVFAYLIVFSKTQYRSESIEEIVTRFNNSDSHCKAFYYQGSINPKLIGTR